MTEAGQPLRVVFLCTHNSARSQMAEALLRHDAPSLKVKVESHSAGVEARGVHPLAVRALGEINVEVEGQTSKTVTDLVAQITSPAGSSPEALFDVVVTVCDNAREACPYLPARLLNLHRQFEDPSAVKGSDEARLAAFCQVRDEIREWLQGALNNWVELAQVRSVQ